MISKRCLFNTNKGKVTRFNTNKGKVTRLKDKILNNVNMDRFANFSEDDIQKLPENKDADTVTRKERVKLLRKYFTNI